MWIWLFGVLGTVGCCALGVRGEEVVFVGLNEFTGDSKKLLLASAVRGTEEGGGGVGETDMLVIVAECA